jgi:hypothetical protein
VNLFVVAGFVVGLAVGVVADLVSEEVRGRLDRVPHWLIRLAARRIDTAIREDVVDEWTAELQEILDIHRAVPLPLTRLFVGTHYALGLLRASDAINRDLSPGRNERGLLRNVGEAVLKLLVHDDIVFLGAALAVFGIAIGSGFLGMVLGSALGVLGISLLGMSAGIGVIVCAGVTRRRQ